VLINWRTNVLVAEANLPSIKRGTVFGTALAVHPHVGSPDIFIIGTSTGELVLGKFHYNGA
jgi:hypothetical protein